MMEIYKLNGVGMNANTYLIMNEEIILIDPGTPENQEILKKELKILNIEFDDVGIIINTHAHYDHAAMDYLFKNAVVYIHPEELSALETGDRYITLSDMFGKPFIPPKNIENIDFLDIDLFDVIHTPGHTMGSISLLFEDKIISGDTIFSQGVGRVDLPTGSFTVLKSSIDKLNDIVKTNNIKELLPGHGPTTTNIDSCFEYARILFK